MAIDNRIYSAGYRSNNVYLRNFEFADLKTEKYNEAVKRHYNRLFWYVAKNAGDRDLAKDIVQDCYLKLWQEKERIDETKIKTWLFSVAHNSIVNHVKRRTRSVSLEEGDIPEPFILMNTEFEIKDVVHKNLNELPQIQRALVVLKDMEGYDYKEIGQMLGLSMDQVKVYLFRGRQKLKNSIRDMSVVI